MSGTKLEFQYSFGSTCHTQIADSLFFSDEDLGCVIYPVGRHIAVRPTETNEMNIIKQPERVTKITAMAMTPEKNRRFLAVAEQILSEQHCQISVYDLKKGSNFKRMRTVVFQEIQSLSIKSMAFSYDSRFLAIVGDEPDYTAVLWDWFKEKVLGSATMESQITRITVSPRDGHLLATTGPNHWKFWRVQENSFKQQQAITNLSQQQNFTDHAWTFDSMLICVNDMGEAFVAKDYEIVMTIANGFGKNKDPVYGQSGMGATSVVCTSRGFILGSDEGTIAMWERAEIHDVGAADEGLFTCVRVWGTGKKHGIVTLALNQSEDTLGVSLRNNDVGTCSLSYAYAQGAAEQKEIKVSMFCSGFHYGAVTGMDVALQRPLLVTCSQQDASVRIWNYIAMKCELAKKLYVVDKDAMDFVGESMSKPLLSVAFHPSGYYLAIGFIDKVRIFHVLYDELRFYKEINVRNATLLKFSNGGQYLACGSGKTVYIYTTYSLELVTTLKHHINNVTDMAWFKKDLSFCTIGTDGKYNEYGTNTFELENSWEASQNTTFSSVFLSHNHALVYGEDGDNCHLFEQPQIVPTGSQVIFNPVQLQTKSPNTCFTYFLTEHGIPTIVAGNKKGHVQLLKVGQGYEPYEDIVAHLGKVTRVRASSDGRYVFSAGEDGTIFIYAVHESDAVQYGSNDIEGKEEGLHVPVDEQLADIVLLKKTELDDFKASQAEIRARMDLLREEASGNAKLEEQKFQQQLTALKESLQLQIDAEKQRFTELADQKKRQESTYDVTFSAAEEYHLNQVVTMEESFQRKIEVEEERYRQLEHEKIEMKHYYEEQIGKISENNQNAISTLTADFAQALDNAWAERNMAHETGDTLKSIYENRLEEQEDEHELEIHENLLGAKKLIKQREQELQQLKEDNLNLQERKSEIKQEMDELKQDDQAKVKETQQLEHVLKKRNNEQEAVNNQNKDLEETLRKKESKIYEYKHQLKDLQRANHNLDQKKREMDEEVKPKDEEIKRLNFDYQKLQIEFQQKNKKIESRQKRIRDLEMVMQRLKQDYKAQKEQTTEKELMTATIINDINKAIMYVDQKYWPEQMKLLYQKYVKNEVKKGPTKGPENLEDMERAVKYMEKSITGMRDTTVKAETRTIVDVRKLTYQNSTLIQELNQLRMDKREYEIQIKQMKKQIDALTETLNIKDKSMRDIGASQSRTQKSVGSLRPRSNAGSRKAPNKLIPLETKSTIQDRQRMVELASDIEEKNHQVYFQKMEIQHLRETLSAERSRSRAESIN